MLKISKLLLGLLFGLFMGTGLALPPMNMPYGVTPLSHEIYELHMWIFYVSCVICAGVFGTLIYTLYAFRKSKGAVSAQFHEHWGIEILWTVLPLVLLIIMAVPATIVLRQIHDTGRPDLNIEITGYQWRWRYSYLDQGLDFFSNLSTPQAEMHNMAPKNPNYLLEVDHPMVVPIQQKIRFLITANDVIHSWWVPELGVKQDAIPGYINAIWAYIEKPGIYRGQCAELCGAQHGFMPIVVEAVTQDEFKRWVQIQQKLQNQQKPPVVETAAQAPVPAVQTPQAPKAPQTILTTQPQ